MTESFLGKIPIVGKFVDERFLEHRRRSSSLAGIVGALVAVGLIEYHYFHDHILSRDLMAVAFSMVLVKMGTMIWYRLNG